MNRTALQVTLACVGGLAVGGLVAGWPWLTKVEPSKSSTTPVAPAAPVVAARSASAALAEAVRTASGDRRWLLLASAAEHATAQDMPSLLRLAGQDSGAASMLAARWAELDPKHMLATIHGEYLLPPGSPAALPGRDHLSDVLVESWSKTDPAALMKALNEIPNFSGREDLRTSAARELCKGDIQLGLRAMKEWNMRHFFPDLKKYAEWVKANPQHAIEAATGLDRDYGGRAMLEQAGKTWGESDPAAALRYAARLRPKQLAAFADEVVRLWAGRDLEAAVAFATAQENPAFRGALAQRLVKEWGKTDAAAALAWSQTNLRGPARNEAIAGLISTTAEKDLHAAGELVAGMESGAAQDRACASLFETWFKKGKEHRDAAFEWLAQLPDESARRNALERVHPNWTSRELDAARDFIKGPHARLAPDSMIQDVSRRLASKNPESALESARSLPPGQSEIAQGAVFDSWLYVRPDDAAAFAGKLPAGPERDRAIQRVAQSFVDQSAERAGGSYRSLPVGDVRDKARAAFDKIGLEQERRAALNKALEGK